MIARNGVPIRVNYDFDHVAANITTAMDLPLAHTALTPLEAQLHNSFCECNGCSSALRLELDRSKRIAMKR